MHSRSGFESYWSLGRPVDDLASLVYLGAHGSDSGLTALVPEDPFADPAAEPVDWPEFVLSTLDVAEGGADELDDYPLYKFFGRIPDEASEAAVYGLPVAAGAGVYEAIVVRALAAVLPGASDPADACD